MKTPITTKGFPGRLLLLSLSSWPVGCFVTYTRSAAQQQQLRPVGVGGGCVNRPLQQHQQQRLQPIRSRGALGALPHPPNRAVDTSFLGFGGQRRLSETTRLESASGMTRLRQVSLVLLSYFFRIICHVCFSATRAAYSTAYSQRIAHAHRYSKLNLRRLGP